jgi:ATP-dependent helicase HrpB
VGPAPPAFGDPGELGLKFDGLADFGVFPIDHVASDVRRIVHDDGVCIVVAPPGTGKTTRLPLLLDPANRSGRLIMTEPRRAAARSAAQRLASTLGERVGQTIGLRMRNDTRVSASTQIEVVTEGVFLRMLRTDVGLTGIGTVVFDEVHERRLDCDVSIALALYARELVRPDLQLIAMSATLDTDATQELLRAQIVKVDSALFDVDVVYRPTLQAELDRGAVAAIAELLESTTGDILVFLPGSREIRATEQRLQRHLTSTGRGHDYGKTVVVAPLLGTSSPEETNAAIEVRRPGTRKVVLATSVAQTSLTIPGVRSVVDSGLSRRATYDERSGVSRLVTERSSQATAIQRSGRAGREAPGSAIRLWSRADYERSVRFDPPEILNVDLAETVLTLASWGITEPNSLRWIDPPSTDRWNSSVSLLQSLALLDSSGRLTPLGESVGDLPTHPRAQAMLAFVREHGDRPSCVRAARLAAEIAGTDELTSTFATYLATGSGNESLSLGMISALVYPDRIAARIGSDPGRYLFPSGGVGILDPDDPARGVPFIVAVELDGNFKGGRIFRSVPVALDEVRQILSGVEQHRTSFLNESGNVEVLVEWRVGALCLERRKNEPTPTDVAGAVLEKFDHATEMATDGVRALQIRRSIAEQYSAGVPDETGQAIAEWPSWDEGNVRELVRAACSGLPTKRPLAQFDLAEILRDSLSYPHQNQLQILAPLEIEIASGRKLRVDYLATGGPTVRSRLQDFLGQLDHPRIASGSIALRVELLSPAQRPAAITSDLGDFWGSGYRAVRSDLRHRYPKHAWPENPLEFTIGPNAANGKPVRTPKHPERGHRR